MDADKFDFGDLYLGVVVDNVDPEGLGRVRVEVPGLLEPASAWAPPLGGSGGGSATSGWFDVPARHAFVGVLLHKGDLDHPYYLGGWHGKGEVPAYLSDVALGERKDVKIYETPRFVFVLDGRGSNETLMLKDKSTGDFISITPAVTTIKASAKVLVETPHAVIDSPNIELGGSPLIPLTDGVVLASGVDTFTGATYGVLGSASLKVKAAK